MGASEVRANNSSPGTGTGRCGANQRAESGQGQLDAEPVLVTGEGTNATQRALIPVSGPVPERRLRKKPQRCEAAEARAAPHWAAGSQGLAEREGDAMAAPQADRRWASAGADLEGSRPFLNVRPMPAFFATFCPGLTQPRVIPN